MTSQNQTFTADQLDTLRDAYATINTASPAMLPRFHALFDGCSDSGLVQLATARIKFVSKLAVNACARRGMSLGRLGAIPGER